MIELYMLERERERGQVARDGRWQAELRRLDRAETAARPASRGPVAWLRELIGGTDRGAALGRG